MTQFLILSIKPPSFVCKNCSEVNYCNTLVGPPCICIDKFWEMRSYKKKRLVLEINTLLLSERESSFVTLGLCDSSVILSSLRMLQENLLRLRELETNLTVILFWKKNLCSKVFTIRCSVMFKDVWEIHCHLKHVLWYQEPLQKF